MTAVIEHLKAGKPHGGLRVPLGEVAEFINGAAFKPTDWEDEGRRIIRIQNLNDSTKPFNRTTRHVPEKLKVYPGDLLVSWSASLGVFTWASDDIAVLNQHIFRVIPDESKVIKAYLRHMLIGALVDMEEHLHGATMKHVNRGEFLSTQIPLPPLDEQRRIAAILDKVDGLRTKRRRALTHLDVLTQSIFQAMFTAESNPHMALGDCLSFITSGGRGWAKYYSNSGSRFIRSLDVQSNYIGKKSEAFVVPPDNAEAKRTRLRQSDVLLTITGSLIGRAAAITPDHIGAYVSQHVAILRPDTKLLSPIFLSHFLNLQNGGQKLIRAVQYGQTKPGLNFEQIRRFAIPQATLADQKKFEDRVLAVERVKDRHQAQLAELDALFGSLQHRAFKGKL